MNNTLWELHLPKTNGRTEKEIFSELADLCTSPGYVHAIAYLCFRDNTIRYADNVTSDDVHQQFSMDRLVRTEISTLIGLACKKELNIYLPSANEMQKYLDKTDLLLKEIHQSMIPSFEEIFHIDNINDTNFNPFRNGTVLRESIFYGGEAAYNFQYRDLSKIKYAKDDAWFLKNKKYSVQQAIDVVTSIYELQNKKINDIILHLMKIHPNDWSLLPIYTFTADEVSTISNIDIEIVKNVINSFISTISMDGFNSLDDFNPMNAYPIIGLDENEYLLFQNYSLVEALYETPFFWFNSDDDYRSIAMDHRGKFTEEFSAERLKLVFGEERVFFNIDIYDSTKRRAGEIDVLVFFANRAIILQAKSKKLTIAARKGNENCLQNDFKKAIQHAYDQAFLCAELLTNTDYILVDSSGNELSIQRNYVEIYPFCVVSDHYPALSFQSMQFLKFQTTETIMRPFVMDIFLLDVLTEMLQSPLQFLSYINRRVFYGEKILSNHELTILSYHLKKNLWVQDQYTMMHLDDDICADLDLAMMTRRENIPGIATPEGVLTKYKDTIYGKIINEIDTIDEAATVNLGFMLLSLSGETIELINDGISKMIKLFNKDGKNHNLMLGFDEANTGLIIHCNNDHISIARPRLEEHCERRKYKSKAKTWFGLCLDPASSRIKFGINLDFLWHQSNEMDLATKDLQMPKLGSNKSIKFGTQIRSSEKIGRNDKCPCGSGKKYKKCCMA